MSKKRTIQAWILMLLISVLAGLLVSACDGSRIVWLNPERDNGDKSDIETQSDTKITTRPETKRPTETTESIKKTADGIALPDRIPQIDSSTARIPITEALYAMFSGTYGLSGPAPICSKTHQALLNLADGSVDLVFAVLPTEEEVSYFDEKNVDVEARLYGCDGLVFMGNSANPVKDLTPEQIKGIYSGRIRNWKELGGDDAPIVAYYRDSQSGSQRFFEKLVWAGEEIPDFSGLTLQMDQVDDMGEITQNVILDKYSIGFNIMSYVDMSFESDDLMLFSVNGVEPNTENLGNGTYEYVTQAYIMIRANEPENSPARWFFNWFGCNESRNLLALNSELSLVFSDPYRIMLSEGKTELEEIK